MKHGLCWRHATKVRGCAMCYPVIVRRVLTWRELRAIVKRGRTERVAAAFVMTWRAWNKTYRGRRSFVEFVREIDPGLPMMARDYRVHPTYYRCEYLLKVGRGLRK